MWINRNSIFCGIFFTIKPGAVSSFCPDTERIVTHNGMVSFMTIIIWFKTLWLIGRGGKRTNRVSRGNINGSFKRIRLILVSFWGAGTIINENERDIQSWGTRINLKGVI